MTNTTRTALPMASTGCACCAPAPAADQAPAAATSTTPSTAAATSAAYQVEGMTCGHCAAGVTEEITALDGVTAVHIDLVPGGTSTVTITADRPLPTETIQAAVDEAGYTLVTT